MAKTVRKVKRQLQGTIPPIIKKLNRRVAAYARVSTNSEQQHTSIEAQKDYYAKMIGFRLDWSFAGLYIDNGISGTRTEHRDGFNQMIQDALDGKIDLIVTKSISRFARNTVDSLSAIRKLKEHNVEVFFEKENIWTFPSIQYERIIDRKPFRIRNRFDVAQSGNSGVGVFSIGCFCFYGEIVPVRFPVPVGCHLHLFIPGRPGNVDDLPFQLMDLKPTDARRSKNHQKHHRDGSAGKRRNPVFAQALFPGEAFFLLLLESAAHSMEIHPDANQQTHRSAARNDPQPTIPCTQDANEQQNTTQEPHRTA